MGHFFDHAVEINASVPQPDGSFERGYGTGYLVADRLVLAAGHTVRVKHCDKFAERSIVRFKLPGDGVLVDDSVHRLWLDTEVVWSRHDDAVDAALLEITDPRWMPRPGVVGRVRWGSLTTSRPGIPCAGIGFPLSQSSPPPPGAGLKVVRDTEHFAGTLNSGTALIQGWHEVTIIDARREITMPEAARAAVRLRTTWAGISGAAVFFGDRVIEDPHHEIVLLGGIVIEDSTSRSAGDRLTLQPVAALATDPLFRSVVEEHTGVPLIVESVEHAGVFEDPCQWLRPDPRHRSPGFLLRADAEVVDFEGRDQKLREYQLWCRSDRRLDVRLVTGDGGQGKTRLARQIATVMREQGWITGHLAMTTTTGQASAVVDRLQKPLLVVIDYADARPDVITALITAAAANRESTVRVLLLARSAGLWWQSVRTAIERISPITEIAAEEALAPLAGDDPARTASYRHAVQCLAKRLDLLDGITSPNGQGPWRQAADRLRDPHLDEDRHQTVLSIHMEALADLLQAGPDSLDLSAGTPAEWVLLGHECRYWWGTAADAEPGPDGAPEPYPLAQLAGQPLLENVIAAATLGAAATEHEAVTVLTGMPELAKQPHLAARLARWAQRVYPPPVGSYWGTLQPDRLGEHFVGTTVASNPHLLHETVPSMSDGQVRRALTVLSRTAAPHGLQDAIDDLVWNFPHRLVPLGGEIAPRLAEPDPIANAVKLATPLLTGDAMIDAAHRLTSGTITLAAFAANLHRIAAEQATDPVTAAAQRIRQAARLADIGEEHAAVDAAHQAVELLRQTGPERRLIFADALIALATNLVKAGDPQSARETYLEALHVLDAVPDGADKPYFWTTALAGLARVLSILGDYDGALNASGEALGVTRQLTFLDANHGRAALARALAVHGSALVDSGCHGAGDSRLDEGISQLSEAIKLWREAARRQPDLYKNYLAIHTGTLAFACAVAGRNREAISHAQDAVTLYRELAARIPRRYLTGLASISANLAIWLFDAGERAQAIAAADEAISAFRAHPKPTPHDLREHAKHLGRFGHRMLDKDPVHGDQRQAVALMDEMVTQARRLCDHQPDIHDDVLAMALSLQAAVLSLRHSRWSEVPALIEEARHTHTEFVARFPDQIDAEDNEIIGEALAFARESTDRTVSVDELIRERLGRGVDLPRESLPVPDHLAKARTLCASARQAISDHEFDRAQELALSAAELLLPHVPNDVTSRDGYVKALNITADALQDLHRNEEAEQCYRHMIDIIEPGHTDDLPEQCMMVNLGFAQFLSRQERFDEAKPHAMQAVSSARAAARRHPELNYNAWLGQALTVRGAIQAALQGLRPASLDYREAVPLLRSAAASDPRWRTKLITAVGGLVSVCVELRQVDPDAPDLLEEAYGLSRGLCQEHAEAGDENSFNEAYQMCQLLLELAEETHRLLHKFKTSP